MKTVDWYFDFISPYAYLQSECLAAFDALATVRPVPVLFAALLGHHGHKGPAEIPSKRIHTYRQVVWQAKRDGIAFKMPASHPFNPLPMLRLFIALGGGRELLHTLFRYVWAQGHLPTDSEPWTQLLSRLGVSDAAALTGSAAVKAALKADTDAALAAGVFGVPTLRIDGTLYWGYDNADMALAALRGDPFLRGPDMRAAEHTAAGIQRA
jgi:2-hydroxychromene-2-carboxylate isomerase